MPADAVGRVMSAVSRPNVLSETGRNLPCYSAQDLTAAGDRALIVLDDQTYTLRITRAGKLILTK